MPDGKDDATGLPIISLYGKDRKPRADDLDGLDALVYDIQDVGTAVLHLHHDARPGARSSQGERQESVRARPAQPDRRPRRCRAGARRTSSLRSSPTMRCRSAMG